MLTKLFGFAFVLVLFVLTANVHRANADIDPIALDQAKKMREKCLVKFPQVTKDVANGIHFGIIPNNPDVNHYIHCVLESMQLVKNGQFEPQRLVDLVKLFLPEKYPDYARAMKECEHAADSVVDIYDACNKMMVCFKKVVGSAFFFP